MTRAFVAYAESAPARSPNRHATTIIIWGLLLTVPFWLPLFGGYTVLAGLVFVLVLAATSFDTLLGFTA